MSKNFEEFKEISNLLEEELKNFDSINDEIIDQQDDIKKIRENYTKYNNLINKGNSHVRDMERLELYEFLFLYFAYIFFWCCVFYVILTRIAILRILKFLFEKIKLLFEKLKFLFDKN